MVTCGMRPQDESSPLSTENLCHASALRTSTYGAKAKPGEPS